MSTEERYQKKFKEFDELVKSGGPWPSDTCGNIKCLRGGCCNSDYHHVYDVCLHCGNDERDIRHMKFRGR